jgi:hypothetical protein
MATFYEIYQNYSQNPYGGINALPGVNALTGVNTIPETTGATPISYMGGGDGIDEVSSVSPVGNVDNVGNVGGFGNVDTSAKGIAGLAASGLIGGPIGLAANVVGQMIGMPSVSDVVGRAMGIGVLVEVIHHQQEQLMQQIQEIWDLKLLIMPQLMQLMLL